jgi:hypothetical protein
MNALLRLRRQRRGRLSQCAPAVAPARTYPRSRATPIHLNEYLISVRVLAGGSETGSGRNLNSRHDFGKRRAATRTQAVRRELPDAGRRAATPPRRASARLAHPRRDQLAGADGRGRVVGVLRGRHGRSEPFLAPAAVLDAAAERAAATSGPARGALDDAPAVRGSPLVVRRWNREIGVAAPAGRRRSIQVAPCASTGVRLAIFRAARSAFTQTGH